MQYRLNKDDLLKVLEGWNAFLKRKVHLIACGGTALTLLNMKNSTKDVDFMVPNEKEYAYLTSTLKKLGYKLVTGSGWKKDGDYYIFDLFCGNKIHTTELMQSPLVEGNHYLFKEYSRIYVGILNSYDLIISKLFRGSTVDFEDCALLVDEKELDIDLLKKKFKETAKYYFGEDKVLKELKYFLRKIGRD
ncbi:MAG: hypothetical protein HQL29_00155 [Candidatus Omnitrophica bacterium]|nr:hypothetical protein [Candidatus Omnitrophota bacterium]